MEDSEKTPVAAGDEKPKQGPREDSLSAPGSSVGADESKKGATRVGKANEEEIPKNRFEVKKVRCTGRQLEGRPVDKSAMSSIMQLLFGRGVRYIESL